MMLQLVDRRGRPDADDLVVLQVPLFKDLVAPLGLPSWAFDLVLIDDGAMAQLNEQYRGKDGVTDVLSFSYLLNDGSGPCQLSGGTGGAYHDLWLDPMALPGTREQEQQIGEIIVAPFFVEDRCRQRHWSLETEFPLLVVHGALHLLGWDHQTDEETLQMRNLEKSYLATGGLPHPLLHEGRFKE